MRGRHATIESLFPSPVELWATSLPPIVLLSLIVWATFNQTLGNALAFDDLDVIFNEAVGSLKNIPFLFSRQQYFGNFGEYTYRPVATFSYFLDNAFLGGKDPAAHARAICHLHNVVLHHINVLLVFALFLLLGVRQWTAFAIALVFAVHPLHTEAVLFPGFREDLQMTLGLLAMSCCLAADRRRPRGHWVVWAPVALAYALFAKEAALLVPVAWLAFDAISDEKMLRERALSRRYILLFLAVAFFVAIRFFVMANPNQGELDVIERLPLKERLLTAPYLFAYYVRKFLWPFPLCVIHEIEPLKAIGPAFYSSLIVAGIVAALVVVLAWRGKWVWLVGLWVVATFAPVSNVYQIINLWAERFYYVVGVGSAAILVAAGQAIWTFVSNSTRPSRQFALAVLGWILIGLLAWGAAICDLKRILDCRTSLSLWRVTARCAPNNGTVLASLAVYEINAGNFKRAEEIALRAEAQGGGVYRFNYILGQAALRQQQWDKAVVYFEKALTVPPPSERSRSELVVSLSGAYLKTGQTDKALSLLRQGAQWDPQNTRLKGLLQKIETKPGDGASTPPVILEKPPE